MKKQLIIAVSREFGSGGHIVAKRIAEKFGISYYDRNLLDEIALLKTGNVKRLQKFDEVPKRTFLSRTVRGISNSPEEIVANIQFDFIRDKAKSGESFVVVGRCAEEVLADFEGLIKIFIFADEEFKIQRTCEYRKVNSDEARGIMNRHDKKRKAYHNYYCTNKWGHAKGYDLTINSAILGLDETAELLEDYIKLRTAD
ncbi:MAG: cytidylate kinase-like family protein [Ruminococcus sp.]|nr:cytidylate kinase-like family protein [Ruminococcus sp.]